MRDRPAWLRIAGAPALGAVLLAALLTLLAAASLAERAHGPEHAHERFFDATWFRALLLMLGVHLLAGASLRFPLTTRRAPLLVAEIGLLLLLAGGIASSFLRVEGTLRIGEGERRSRFTVDEEILLVRNRDRGEGASVELDAALRGGLEPLDRPDVGPLDLAAVEGVDAVEVVRYVPDLVWRDEAVDASEGDPGTAPAALVTVDEPGGAETAWVFAGRETRFGALAATLRTVDDPAALVAEDAPTAGEDGRAPIELLRGPDGALVARLSWPGTPTETVTVEPGTPFDTPWPEKRITVVRPLDRATIARVAVVPADVRPRRAPALRVRLHAAGATEEVWVSKYEPREVALGETTVDVVYADAPRPLGFDLELRSFRVVPYPGGRLPRSFESRVTLIDAATGRSTERVVSMNRPVTFGGLTLTQSSYRREADRAVSVLGVARDPSRPITFAGFVVAALGLIAATVGRLLPTRSGG